MRGKLSTDARPCTPPVTSNFTWTQGVFTATNTDVTNGPTLLQVTYGPGFSFDKGSMFLKNIPSTPYTLTARFSYSASTVAQTTYGGLCISDGTKAIALGIIGEGNTWRNILVKMNHMASYGGEYWRLQLPMNPNDMYMRVVDDGTNRLSYFSNDGVHWTLIHTVGRTDFLTATKYGMLVAVNGSVGLQSRILWISDE